MADGRLASDSPALISREPPPPPSPQRPQRGGGPGGGRDRRQGRHALCSRLESSESGVSGARSARQLMRALCTPACPEISDGESGGTWRLGIAVDFSAFPIRRFTASLLRPFRQSQSASLASLVKCRVAVEPIAFLAQVARSFPQDKPSRVAPGAPGGCRECRLRCVRSLPAAATEAC